MNILFYITIFDLNIVSSGRKWLQLYCQLGQSQIWSQIQLTKTPVDVLPLILLIQGVIMA
jgi:hypothetical protein